MDAKGALPPFLRLFLPLPCLNPAGASCSAALVLALCPDALLSAYESWALSMPSAGADADGIGIGERAAADDCEVACC